MPINYGVFKGVPLEPIKLGKDERHLEICALNLKGNEKYFRTSINIKSYGFPSEVLYYVEDNFTSPHISSLPQLPFGYTEINQENRKFALDYVRGRLFTPSLMKPLPNIEPGPDNDLNEKLSQVLNEAIKRKGILYAFGERWGPIDRPDEYFKFLPSNGIHNIHMNQGSVEPWRKDNGIWQDGGLLIHFEEQRRWVGIFLAFQSQSWCTDDEGHDTVYCSHNQNGNIKK
ncbi:uncharacterized protein YukJ [Natranaerovirga pectinivora]|uniref:Uncharacterized protein YukJ n=1 Tax=Natranaerovirga pectinivora TaxID=682400 RepID=A0A4R3ML28_9FIRM|nr:YukJ family protein [Natranaerovirga pectinivora]TCT15382.1 uncharacterized protein YukJ [Natranaerovirga pectinivora]